MNDRRVSWGGGLTGRCCPPRGVPRTAGHAACEPGLKKGWWGGPVLRMGPPVWREACGRAGRAAGGGASATRRHNGLTPVGERKEEIGPASTPAAPGTRPYIGSAAVRGAADQFSCPPVIIPRGGPPGGHAPPPGAFAHRRRGAVVCRGARAAAQFSRTTPRANQGGGGRGPTRIRPVPPPTCPLENPKGEATAGGRAPPRSPSTPRNTTAAAASSGLPLPPPLPLSLRAPAARGSRPPPRRTAASWPRRALLPDRPPPAPTVYCGRVQCRPPLTPPAR